MPENQSTSSVSVSYDSLNRDLRTVRFYFAAQEKSVQDFRWEEDITVGARIEPGKLLAHIRWDSPPDERVVAPEGCEGEIEWINGRIDFTSLHRKPEELLRLKPEEVET
jgi:hypothetical protein